MISLRNGTTAFLRNNGKYLLMERAAEREIAPGVWSGVGGHMEQAEINDPLSACFREIEEETGITKSDIRALELMYIIIRRRQNEIRQIYIYFGETMKTDIVQTREGWLSWIPENELLNRQYSQTFAAMLEHYTCRDINDTSVYIGVADNDNGNLRMTWAKCEDFEGV